MSGQHSGYKKSYWQLDDYSKLIVGFVSFNGGETRRFARMVMTFNVMRSAPKCFNGRRVILYLGWSKGHVASCIFYNVYVWICQYTTANKCLERDVCPFWWRILSVFLFRPYPGFLRKVQSEVTRRPWINDEILQLHRSTFVDPSQLLYNLSVSL